MSTERVADLCIAVFLTILAVIALRFASGNFRRGFRQDLPDLIVGGALLGSTVLLTLRPASSALLWASLAAGLALADYTKRQVLREPVVYADADELLQVFSHPHFYIPFAGPLAVYGGGGLLAAATVALFLLEPQIVAGPAIWLRVLGALLLLLPVAAYLHRPSLDAIARLFSRLGPTGEPEEDSAQFGLLGSIALYSVLGRHTRTERRHAARFGALRLGAERPPIVVVQAESFFDLSRFEPQADAFLGNYAAAKASAHRYGRLRVPTWGANTIRSEFAVVSGLSSAELGLDRFNPYHAFARHKLDTLVWRLRLAGYATICVHPYDKRFYARHKVMPNLGFERFVSAEDFPPPEGRYTPDAVLADWVNRLVEEETRPVFVFAISVANHGPWRAAGPAPFTDAEVAGYAQGLRDTDTMLGLLAQAPWLRERRGILAFYGDHQPSIRRLADAPDSDTDYLLLDHTSDEHRKLDLPVHRLGHLIAERLHERADAETITLLAGD